MGGAGWIAWQAWRDWDPQASPVGLGLAAVFILGMARAVRYCFSPRRTLIDAPDAMEGTVGDLLPRAGQPNCCPFVRTPATPSRSSAMHEVAKVIEVIGTSSTGIEDAIQTAVKRASKTVDNLQWFEVTEIRGALNGGAVDRYQVMLKIGFGLTDD